MQKNRQTALLGRGASAPYERFAAGKTSAQAEFISAEHVKWTGFPQKRSFCGIGRTVGSGVVIDIEE